MWLMETDSSKHTVYPPSTAFTPKAIPKWVFPIPGGPKKSKLPWLSIHRKSNNCDTSDFVIPFTRPNSNDSKLLITGKCAADIFLLSRLSVRSATSRFNSEPRNVKYETFCPSASLSSSSRLFIIPLNLRLSSMCIVCS